VGLAGEYLGLTPHAVKAMHDGSLSARKTSRDDLLLLGLVRTHRANHTVENQTPCLLHLDSGGKPLVTVVGGHPMCLASLTAIGRDLDLCLLKLKDFRMAYG